jgi:copper homeostasis protein
VTGVLTPAGALDTDALHPIYAAARQAAEKTHRTVDCTLHRAFDVCCDPFAALEAAKQLGLTTILTSGQAASAPQGAALLRQLVEAAGQEVEILVGAGVSAANIPALAAQTGSRAFHLSGKQVLDSRMTFRREGVPMGLPGFSEFEIWQTSEANIRAARTVLDAL